MESDPMHQRLLAPEPGTLDDARDMTRMNKLQELNVGSASMLHGSILIVSKRLHSRTTLTGYAALIGLTWPFALITGTLSLTNGGTAGAVWVFLGVSVGMFSVVLSMAEMASM